MTEARDQTKQPAGENRGDPAGTGAPQVSSRAAKMIIIATGLGVIMDGIDLSAVSLANPVLAVQLDTTLSDLQWVTNGYVLAMAATLIGAGKLGDRFGHKRLFLIGLAGFALSSLLVGLAGNVTVMIAMRIVQGVFGAILLPTSLAILRLVFPPDKLKSAVGVWGAMAGLATAASPLVGGIVVGTIGWQWVFFVNVPIAAVSFLLTLRAVPRLRAQRQPEPIDLPGVALLAVWLAAVQWAIISGPVRGWTSAPVLIAFALAAVAFVLFCVREVRGEHSLIPLRIFSSPALSGGAIVLVLAGMASFGTIFYVALYLQQVRGESPLQAGLSLLPVTGMFMIGAPIGAQLNRRTGPRIPVAAGMLLIAVGAFGLTLIELGDSINSIWPFLLSLGLGMGMASPTATEVVVSNAQKRFAGVASGLERTAGMFGAAFGTAVFGTLIVHQVATTIVGRLSEAGVDQSIADDVHANADAAAQGFTPIPPGTDDALAQKIITAVHAAYVDGLHVAMYVAAALALAGAVVAWTVLRAAPSEAEETDASAAQAQS